MDLTKVPIDELLDFLDDNLNDWDGKTIEHICLAASLAHVAEIRRRMTPQPTGDVGALSKCEGPYDPCQISLCDNRECAIERETALRHAIAALQAERDALNARLDSVYEAIGQSRAQSRPAACFIIEDIIVDRDKWRELVRELVEALDGVMEGYCERCNAYITYTHACAKGDGDCWVQPCRETLTTARRALEADHED